MNRPAAARALFVWFGVAKRNIERAGSLGPQGKGVGGLWALGESRWEGREEVYRGCSSKGLGGGVGWALFKFNVKFRFGVAFESRVR